ncbi:hypothetical protein [Bacillus weihaiensis]|uniref:hypothetical protein n=1 Tax=Bacillus weihaiensis TaxID=1547283 RepID=UPI0023539BBE|nr:hypothetical protein [Bacillus weihaiensis]
MITLENIGLNETGDTVVIFFSFEGEYLDIVEGELKIPKEEWIESKISGEPDDGMIARYFKRQLFDFLGCELNAV